MGLEKLKEEPEKVSYSLGTMHLEILAAVRLLNNSAGFRDLVNLLPSVAVTEEKFTYASALKELVEAGIIVIENSCYTISEKFSATVTKAQGEGSRNPYYDESLTDTDQLLIGRVLTRDGVSISGANMDQNEITDDDKINDLHGLIQRRIFEISGEGSHRKYRFNEGLLEST